MREENVLPSGWVQTTLGEVCSRPQYGWTTKANFRGGLVKLLRTTDISGGFIDWDTVPYCTEIPEDLNAYRLAEGDIVISRAGSVGVSYLLSHVPAEAVFASYLIRFRPSQEVNPQYVSYYLQTPEYWSSIHEQSAGIALANVNARKLEAIELPLAPLAEQQRIVAAIEQQFSRLDAGVAALRRAQAKLKRYRAAILKAAVEGKLTEAWRAEHPTTEPASQLQERILTERRAKWETDLKAKGKDPAKVKYVEPAKPETEGLPGLPEGWCWATVDQIADVIGGVTKGRNLAGRVTTVLPYLRVANVQRNFLDLSVIKTIEVPHDEVNRYLLCYGDVLLTEGGDADKLGSLLKNPSMDEPSRR